MEKLAEISVSADKVRDSVIDSIEEARRVAVSVARQIALQYEAILVHEREAHKVALSMLMERHSLEMRSAAVDGLLEVRQRVLAQQANYRRASLSQTAAFTEKERDQISATPTRLQSRLLQEQLYSEGAKQVSRRSSTNTMSDNRERWQQAMEMAVSRV